MRVSKRRLTAGFISLFLLSFAAVSPARAQSGMSSEDEAVYRNMMKASGVDIDLVLQQKAQADDARKWTEGNNGVVIYRVTGEYDARTDIVGGSNGIGYADVTDRVEIDLEWSVTETKPIGIPTIRNFPAGSKNVRNPEPSCSAPRVRGEYDHFELTAVKEGIAGGVELHGVTHYPAAEVANFCTEGWRAHPALAEPTRLELFLMPPTMLSMPGSSAMVTEDKKSFIHKAGGWTWTLTPSVKE